MTRVVSWVASVAVAAAIAITAAARAAPPSVALQVEWRWVDAMPPPPVARAAAGGAKVVGTAGAFDARPGVAVRSGAAAEPVVQQLSVMNGATAQLRMVDQAQLPSVELFRTPRGTGGVVSPMWVGQVQSFAVTPRWAGGAAPVELDLVAESHDGGAQQRWASTVRVPLGQWQTVARSGVPPPGVAAGVTATSHATATPVRELQVRVAR